MVSESVVNKWLGAESELLVVGGSDLDGHADRTIQYSSVPGANT